MSTSEASDRQPSIAELLQRFRCESRLLARQEWMLAKAEMAEKGKHAGIGAGMFAGALIAAVAAFGALTACLIAAIALALPVWAAALIVTLMWIGVGGVLVILGRKQLMQATPPLPELAVQTIKEDVEWAKTQLPFSRR